MTYPRYLKTIAVVLLLAGGVFAQDPAQKIADAERDFAAARASAGVKRAYLDFLTSDAICFPALAQVNCVEYFTNAGETKPLSTRTPAVIDVSTNGSMAYSTGAVTGGEYLSVWMRRPNGSYGIALDVALPVKSTSAPSWRSPADLGKEPNAARSSAADTAREFFEMVRDQGAAAGYRKFLAADSRLVRAGADHAFTGRDEALREVKKDKSKYLFKYRSVFTQAADLAYVTNRFRHVDKNEAVLEEGYFVQVWKLREGRWQIVVDFTFVDANKPR